MNRQDNSRVNLCDLKPGRERFLKDVIAGLRKSPKELPSKYFYDERGAALFERICSLEEYYIPRVEAAIMEENIGDIAGLLGRRVLLIEFGSGDCAKTRILLDNLSDIAGFVPVDIAREQLVAVADRLSADYPSLEVLPVCADFTQRFQLPAPGKEAERVVAYFAGSNISNFDPLPTRRFLEHIASVCGARGRLLIGIDLKKDPAVLHRAYNDSQGVTAEFNLNLLRRINNELDGDFDLDGFRHRAFYNPEEGRVEMHLVSLREQSVHLDNTAITFAEGESIWTESSYKYTPQEFRKLAADAGFKVERVWTDDRQWFSIQYLTTG